MQEEPDIFLPRLIAFEVTRACPLKCVHCRASATCEPPKDELSLDEIKKILKGVSSFSKPVIILTGGEALCRADIFEIASFGSSLGLPMALATCGYSLTEETMQKLKNSGISRLSLSIDGPNAEVHDKFRGVENSYEHALNSARLALQCGIPFQVNTTVTKKNRELLPEMVALASKLGAVSFHPFFLVPTGRAKELQGLEMNAHEYEGSLSALFKISREVSIEIKPTCAPQYGRISNGKKGCIAGSAFAFISNTGMVQPCGFLNVECGDLRKGSYDFKKIWDGSDVFGKLRVQANYKGKCGICDRFDVCGGCRARAHEMNGNYLGKEPNCEYSPKRGLDDMDKKILNVLQTGFPLESHPFAKIAAQLSIKEDDVIARVKALKESGLIRRIGPLYDPKALGYKSMLMAIKTPDEHEERAVNFINSHDGVTHNYKREGPYNIWFTFIYRTDDELTGLIAKLKGEYKAEEVIDLPATHTYKLNATFGT